MGKKKQIEGAVVSIDLPADQASQHKKKREVSEKQLENLKKGMAILKAKREAKSKQQDNESVQEVAKVPEPEVPRPEVVAPPVSEPVKEQKRERKPRVVKNYLTTDDFNNFKNELFTTLKKPEPTTPLPPIKEVVKEVMKEAPLAQSVVVKERLITGRELLDKIFNF